MPRAASPSVEGPHNLLTMFEQIFNSHQVIFYSELGNLRPHKVLVAGVIVTIYREYSIGFYYRTKKSLQEEPVENRPGSSKRRPRQQAPPPPEQTHHRDGRTITLNDLKKRPKGPTLPRSYICPYAGCTKTYTKSSHLKAHIR